MTIEEVDQKLIKMNFSDIVKSYYNKLNDIEKLKIENKELNDQLRLHSVSNDVAIDYARYCVTCDREGIPTLCLEDYIKECHQL